MASYAGAMNGHEAYSAGLAGGYGVVEASESDRMYGLFLNLMPLLILTGLGWVAALIGAVVMWRIKANDSAFLDAHGREVTNFVISLGVWVVLLVVVGLILAIGTFMLALPLLIIVGGLFYLAGLVVILVGSIRGAIAAHNGQLYRFPATFRLLG